MLIIRNLNLIGVQSWTNCSLFNSNCNLVSRVSLPTSFRARPSVPFPRETEWPRFQGDYATSSPGRPFSQKRPWERRFYVWFNAIICSLIFRYLSFLSSTGVLFIFSTVAMIFFYKYFARDAQCRTNLYFVSFSLCQYVAATVISVLPKVQEAQSGTGKWRHEITTNCLTFGPVLQVWRNEHL